MLEPYKHVLLTHLALLVGGAFAMWMHHPAPILTVMILGKLAIDRRKIRDRNSRSSPQN